MSTVQDPTLDFVEHYIHTYNNSDAGTSNRALSNLVCAFPTNDSLEPVLCKVAAINGLYSTGIGGIYAVAQNILRQQIDSKLVLHDVDLVNQIAPTQFSGGKIRRNFSFATKYCHFHAPDAFPIYDSYVRRLLWAYIKRDSFVHFKSASAFQNILEADYGQYKMLISTFQQFYGLGRLGFAELDKFLWLYGKELDA